jgi:hypothetical protein
MITMALSLLLLESSGIFPTVRIILYRGSREAIARRLGEWVVDISGKAIWGI